MSISLNILEFNAFSLAEKLSFFEDEIKSLIISFENKEVNNFLKNIILNNSENSTVRKEALKIYIECVFLGKIKARQALSLLIDEWDNDADIFLKLQRLKDLYFFYNEEEIDIESIYKENLNEDEAELVSEAYVNLGLIYMQKGFSSNSREESLSFLKKSKEYFYLSSDIIENRIDAKIYEITVSIIIDSLNGFKESASQNLKEIASLLFKKEAFSFKNIDNPFYLGFYRALNSINLIDKNKPDNWLNYRKEFTQLYNQYSEINNQALKERLNKSIMSSIFIDMAKKQFIEPYFALNFHAQIAHIDARLTELDSSSEEYDFLMYIKSLASNKNYKKKAEKNSIRDSLINMFPERSSVSIDESLEKIKDDRNPLDLLSIISDLQAPSIKEFIDKLVYSCLKLQGSRLYIGDFSEDDRNTFISYLLESSGYSIKDQTRWSKSVAGKSAGEIDIFIQDKKGFPFSIIEALNLNSLKADYTALHIDKIFDYDTTGLEFNFILVYSSAKNFSEFCKKYTKFISEHSYKYRIISFEEINDYRFTDIKIVKAKHLRNDKELYLYHLMVDLSD